MALRAIQPAPGGLREPPEEPSGDKKTRSIQACDECRRTKAKCSGKRPKCNMCITKNRECTYVGTSRQMRSEVSRLRVESLERLFSVLRTATSDEADRLLERIRTTDDPSDALDLAISNKIPSRVTSDSALAVYQQSTMEKEQPGELERVPAANMSPDNPTTPSQGVLKSRPYQSIQGSENPMGGSFSSSGMNSQLPDPSLTERAAESFFSCSGSVLHVFTREQVLKFHESVFRSQKRSTEDVGVEIGALMAVSAVGAQSQPDKFSQEQKIHFYNLAKSFFGFVISKHPFHAIKVCTLLAHYSILDKDMMSLAYIDIGLSMARKHGLERALQSQHPSDPKAIDLRRTWRTLVFVSSWLSSTLGYISGSEMISAREVESATDEESSEELTDEIMQTEMAKICLLKADILRLHLNFKHPSVTAMESICRDLQTWYKQLPSSFRLDRCSGDDVPEATRRSIFHMHLLHLGAIILLYRQNVTYFLQKCANNSSSNLTGAELPVVILEQSADAALAADTSARIIQLFFLDTSLCKRWWLFIFQTYTTCTLLLHIAVQKKIHDYNPSTWAMEKKHAEGCISILACCGEADGVALKFHEQLVDVYNKTFSQEPSLSLKQRDQDEEDNGPSHFTSPTSRDDSSQPCPIDPRCLLHLPRHARAELVDLSLTLLMMLSQPFGNSSHNVPTDINFNKGSLDHPLFHEYPQVSTRLNWEPDNVSFRWDVSKLHASLSDLSLGLEAGVPNQTQHSSGVVNY